MRIDASGRVGIGITNPAYKLVVSNGGASGIEFGPAYSGTSNLIQHYNRSGAAYVDAVNIAAQHRFAIGGNEAMRINASGNVGIGTSSPSVALEVDGTIKASGNGKLQIADDTEGSTFEFNVGGGGALEIYDGAAERMRIDSSGHLLVGTTSANYAGVDLAVGNTTDSQNGIQIQTSTTGYGYVLFGDGTGASAYVGQITYKHDDNFMAFNTAGAERMRIDSSGNFLVGHSSLNGTGGVDIGTSGYVRASRSGDEAAIFNRETNDGTIVSLQKDGTSVGSIGTVNGDLLVGTGDTGLRFHDTDNRIYPINTSGGTKVDAAIDLGDPTARFKDLYLSGGAYLGGTAAANKLDDYEEGTWTPVLEGNTGQSGQTYSAQVGTYTKIGRQVTCRFKLVLTAEGTFTNAYILLAGLPFALASSPQTVHMGNLYFTDMGTNFISVGLQGYEANSKAYLWGKKSATASREYVGINELSNTTSLTGTFTYEV
jgi:hypothetical protein